jgi:hypothetical protein
VRRARERELECSAKGATERGERVSVGKLQKRAQVCGGVAGKHMVVGASTAECVGERLLLGQRRRRYPSL